MLHVNLNNNLVDGCTNMSVGMSHSSCIHFRVHIMSHDMIQHGMTLKEFNYAHIDLIFKF